MKRSVRKILIATISVCALGLIAVLLVLVFKDTGRAKPNISVNDLTVMKTLVHEYLNERKRAIVSVAPESDPNVSGAPTISPKDMSSELAVRQEEDVNKLLNSRISSSFSDFVVLTELLAIDERADKVILCLRATTYYRNVNNPDKYSATSTDRYFTFDKKGDGWSLTDVKLPFAGTEPPEDEPNVQANEKGTSRVLADPPEQIFDVPHDIAALDAEATKKIVNEWAIDKKAEEAYSQRCL